MARTPLFQSARCLLLFCGPLPLLQTAQAADSAPRELDATVITATKQDTPAFNTANSVSVVNGEKLADSHLDTLGDVAQRLPNVYFSTFTQHTPSLTIRGLGFSDDEGDSISNSVYIDGVPMNGMVLGQLYDLEQIEVLRGPQNTLYGQNSMGGLVALRTRDPAFDAGGRLKLEYGSHNRQRAEFAGNLPLSGNTALRLSAGGEQSDGMVANPTLGRHDSAGWNSGFGRIKLLHLDDDGGEWRFALHQMNTHGDNDYFAPRELARKHESNATDTGRNDTAYTLFGGEYRKRYADDTQLVVNLGANRTEWDYWLPESIFGGEAGYDMETRQYSAEARLNGERGKWDWLVGGFLSHVRRDAPYTFDLSPYYLSDTKAKVTGDTAAAFGELGWRFQPDWRLAAGLRLEHNRRSMDWSSQQSGLFDSNGDGVPDTPFDSLEAFDDRKVNETEALPRLSLEYSPSDQHFSYLVLARGYKASGFNTYATGAAAAGNAYDPEYGNYVELGYRYRAPDNLWQAGANLFYTRLRDQQVIVEDVGGQTFTSNAGKSHNKGVELTATLFPLASVQLNAYASFVEAEFDDYSRGSVDYAGKQFPSTPRHSFGVSMDWAVTDCITFGTGLTRQGESNLYPSANIENDAYTLWDANLDYRLRQWSIGLFGKNLSDATYYTRAMANDMVIAGQPRTVGMRVGMEF
ncbi:Outer membrane receptor proteins, mostly Fe transport [Pseudomonas delhiensis]|uniref:Outer membrane receptor proteins, mostly Fe transport n=1 Tax=Pseudomonas delhiensis TaxID=366289 RepID=A0A239I8G6_9PSED|nr:TonB-dependent receptor [Pseudomonas delhiensis]SDJ56777.1 Outer membrane receptor proteins, mostly Fe transport [Pseudomonas delhiensis]SNS89890.1 Outer membrane receptor proteins, mostly Fe transport [Pseudomonas delhiensis]